jgi:hypothetical protein
MAMELFMYLIYLAYTKNSITHTYLSIRACNVNVTLVSFSPENARFCFLETG